MKIFKVIMLSSIIQVTKKKQSNSLNIRLLMWPDLYKVIAKFNSLNLTLLKEEILSGIQVRMFWVGR